MCVLYCFIVDDGGVDWYGFDYCGQIVCVFDGYYGVLCCEGQYCMCGVVDQYQIVVVGLVFVVYVEERLLCWFGCGEQGFVECIILVGKSVVYEFVVLFVCWID